jgi:dihydroneopterin aldolase
MLHARKEPHFASVDFDYEHPALVTVGQPKWTLIIKDLLVSCRVGIYPHEYNRPQQVLINLKCDYYTPTPTPPIEMNQPLCYDQLVQSIHAFIKKDHVHFIENLAEEIANICFSDKRICTTKITIEKLEALADAKSVGIEIVRIRKDDDRNR